MILCIPSISTLVLPWGSSRGSAELGHVPCSWERIVRPLTLGLRGIPVYYSWRSLFFTLAVCRVVWGPRLFWRSWCGGPCIFVVESVSWALYFGGVYTFPYTDQGRPRVNTLVTIFVFCLSVHIVIVSCVGAQLVHLPIRCDNTSLQWHGGNSKTTRAS